MGRTFTPKTPGVYADPDTEPTEGAEPGVELVMQPAPDIAAMIEEGIRKGVAAALATSARAMVQAQPEHLPNAHDVDPNSISEWVLTKQGYVVPAKYGNFAADIVKR